MDSTPSPPHSTQRTAMPGKRKAGGYCREQRVPCVKLRMSATAVHASPKQRVVCENVSSRQLPLHTSEILLAPITYAPALGTA